MNDDYYDNPLHGIGYGRGDETAERLKQTQPIRRQTMAYSVIDEEEIKRRHSGTASAKLADLGPTEAMPSIPPSMPVTTVQLLVKQIIERDITAWLAIPNSIRDMMMATPEKFMLVSNPAYPNDIPFFSYGGMLFKWNGAESWMLTDKV